MVIKWLDLPSFLWVAINIRETLVNPCGHCSVNNTQWLPAHSLDSDPRGQSHIDFSFPNSSNQPLLHGNTVTFTPLWSCLYAGDIISTWKPSVIFPPDLFSEVSLSSYTNSHEFYAQCPVCLFFFPPLLTLLIPSVQSLFSVQCPGLPRTPLNCCNFISWTSTWEELRENYKIGEQSTMEVSFFFLLSAFWVHCFWHRLFTVRVLLPPFKTARCLGTPFFVEGMIKEMSQRGVCRVTKGWKDVANTTHLLGNPD